jgi:hypothetical protein
MIRKMKEIYIIQTSEKQKLMSARLLLYPLLCIQCYQSSPTGHIHYYTEIKSRLMMSQHTCQPSSNERKHPSSGDCWGHNTFMPFRRQLEFIPATKKNHISIRSIITDSKHNPYDPVIIKSVNKIHETKFKGKLVHRRI